MSDDQAAERLQRAKAGDGRAFEELLAPALDPALRLAMTMLYDRGAAEDAVQEAALRAGSLSNPLHLARNCRWSIALGLDRCAWYYRP